MIYVGMSRLTQMLTNAIESAKTAQGTKKPHPVVMLVEYNGLTVSGVGQWTYVEDREPGETAADEATAIRLEEAVEVAKILRSHPDAGKKHTTVAVSCGEILTVDYGSERLVEIADVGDEADTAWGLRLEAIRQFERESEEAREVVVYDAKILGLLGKLKPSNGDARVALYPAWAGDSTRFVMGSVRGFVEGNRTQPDEVGALF